MRRIGDVQSRSDVQATFRIQLHPVGSASCLPVIDQCLSRGFNLTIRPQLKSPQLACSALRIVVVRHIQKSIVGRDRQPVGTIHLLRNNADHAPIGIDPIDPLNLTSLSILHFHARTIAITRICEIQTVLRIQRQIIRLIESLPLECLSKDRR